jgi:hypothetical protein
MAASAAMMYCWSLAGSLSSCLWARLAVMSCQGILELFEGDVLPAADLSAPAADGREFRLGDLDHRNAAGEVVA